METLKKCCWLWGQTPGSHHITARELPGINRMTPIEGCRYFDIKNCFRVIMSGLPLPPYDHEAEALAGLDQVVWSITGSLDTKRNDDGIGDLNEVIRLAQKYRNITGGILDDFFNPERIGFFAPETLTRMRRDLNRQTGRPMELWVVVYEHELDWDIAAHLKECDRITFWTWNGDNLPAMEKNFFRLREMVPGKRFYTGFYLWDYVNKHPLSLEQMSFQCSRYLDWWQRGLSDGIILCSNCTTDIGLESSPWTRDWLASIGNTIRMPVPTPVTSPAIGACI